MIGPSAQVDYEDLLKLQDCEHFVIPEQPLQRLEAEQHVRLRFR